MFKWFTRRQEAAPSENFEAMKSAAYRAFDAVMPDSFAGIERLEKAIADFPKIVEAVAAMPDETQRRAHEYWLSYFRGNLAARLQRDRQWKKSKEYKFTLPRI